MPKSIIAVLTLFIFIPHSHSKKNKRSVVNSLKSKLINKFQVSVSEIGETEKWQTATIQVVHVSKDLKTLDSIFKKILLSSEQILIGKAMLSNYKLEFIKHKIG